MQGPSVFYPMSPMAYPTHSPYFGGGQDGNLAAPNPNMGAYQPNQQYQQQQYQQQQYQQQQYQQPYKKWKQKHGSHAQWGEEPSMGQQEGMHYIERFHGREGQQKHPTELVEGMSDEGESRDEDLYDALCALEVALARHHAVSTHCDSHLALRRCE